MVFEGSMDWGICFEGFKPHSGARGAESSLLCRKADAIGDDQMNPKTLSWNAIRSKNPRVSFEFEGLGRMGLSGWHYDGVILTSSWNMMMKDGAEKTYAEAWGHRFHYAHDLKPVKEKTIIIISMSSRTH